MDIGLTAVPNFTTPNEYSLFLRLVNSWIWRLIMIVDMTCGSYGFPSLSSNYQGNPSLQKSWLSDTVPQRRWLAKPF